MIVNQLPNHIDMPFMDKIQDSIQAITNSLNHKDIHIAELGNVIPASLMIQDLEGDKIVGCSYMNNWGCKYLNTTVEEINSLGEAYYEKYFFPGEIQYYLQETSKFIQENSYEGQYNFFQRVRKSEQDEFSWFFTVCKLICLNTSEGESKKLIVLSSPVEGMNTLITRVNKTLNLEGFVANNFIKFSTLTKREKEILSYLAQGKSTTYIANKLFISHFTVSTHRRNLMRKIECNSPSELLRFAIAFEVLI